MTQLVRVSFRGIGRIERRSGFRDPGMTKRLREMCRVLYEAGRDDILRDLQAGRLTFREAWAFYRRGDWQRIPTAQHAWDFLERFTAWFAPKPPLYRRFCRAVAKAVGPGSLATLRARLLAYRGRCEAARTGAMFNRAVTTKDGRDTFALWCDLAGLPEAWKGALLGHGPHSVTQGYGWQESERILNAAETALRKIVNAPVDTLLRSPTIPYVPSTTAATQAPKLPGGTDPKG